MILNEWYQPLKQSGWVTIYSSSTFNGADIEVYHTVPDFGMAHYLVGDCCECKPKLQWFSNGNATVVHNPIGHIYLTVEK